MGRYKPADFFRVDRDLGRFERWFRDGPLLAAPAGPGAPGWSPTTPTPGTITVTIHTAPIYPGDGLLAGDDLGVITGYVIVVGGDATTHPASPLPIVRTVTGLAPTPVLVEVWALGFFGRPGDRTTAYVTPTAEPEAEFAYLIDAVTGAAIIDDETGVNVIDAWPYWPLLGQTAPGVWEELRGRTDAGIYETLLGRAA